MQAHRGLPLATTPHRLSALTFRNQLPVCATTAGPSGQPQNFSPAAAGQAQMRRTTKLE